MKSIQGVGAVRWPWLFLMALAMTACHLMNDGERGPAVELPSLDVAAAQKYRIDPALSAIQLKVYRDGLLARLGHNHVIAATAIEGAVYRRDPLANSSFELSFPVAGLKVDRPNDRRRAGADFPGEIPQAHIDGTRTNMLSPQLLNAEQYPTIELRSIDMTGRPPMPVWRVAVRVRDRVTEISVPVQFMVSGRQLIIQGALSLSQRELGLEPFCVLGGKLCVRDTIDAEFYLVAVAAP